MNELSDLAKILLESYWKTLTYQKGLGGPISYQTAKPTKNGAYRDFLKIDEISNFFD